MAISEKTQGEKFKTMIGGQELIEGIMMRGPEKDAVVVTNGKELTVEVHPRKVIPPKSIKRLPFIRGMVNFFDSQVVGVKALMRSADLAPEEYQEEPSKLDLWLEKMLGNETFQKVVVGIAVAMGMGLSIVLFFLLPMVISGFLDGIIHSTIGLNLVEGLIRMVIFMAYMILISRMGEMKRVFAYHGAEHKTIRCYEAELPLTVENVRPQTRLHPRCGTSFLFVVIIISILVSAVFSAIFPIGNTVLRMLSRLVMLPFIVAIAYEFNRLVARHDNALTRALTAPGMWFQLFTTNEPDDSMIEVAIEALTLVLPEQEGADRW